MPLKYRPEGATDEIEVFTPEEVEAQTRQAAEAAREAARKEMEADPNGVAAQARRAAEARQREAEKTAAAKEAELAKALADTGKSAEELKAIQTQLAEARKEAEQAKGEAELTKADFARKTALIEAGAKPAKVGAVEAMLKADGVDLSDSAAVQKALETMKTEAPGLFVDGKAAGYKPAGGAANPPKTPGVQSVEEVEKMTPREYNEWYAANYGKRK